MKQYQKKYNVLFDMFIFQSWYALSSYLLMQKDNYKSKTEEQLTLVANWVTITELTTHTLPPNAFPLKAS